MKYINLVKKYRTFDLQLFAEGENSEGAGGDDQDEDDSDEDGEDEENEEDSKKFSQKEVDEAVKRRLAREKRKWQRQQQSTKKPDSEDKAGNDEAENAAKEAERKATKLEVKVACYEADVAKESVDDVAALARAYMEADEDMDLEEAIEKVVKKYPHFKKSAADPYEEEQSKPWGQRQTGRGSKKMTGVESKFYELNPDLKK